jgi:hypothetical protein
MGQVRPIISTLAAALSLSSGAMARSTSAFDDFSQLSRSRSGHAAGHTHPAGHRLAAKRRRQAKRQARRRQRGNTP